ncbi:protein-serine/threonine phosphatase [Phytobacter sp. V91]|uniref:protein-serine/threonine phosphatase n=1 Tax=Phytobacter sp. V91 TaxID=3369425 RepID=UPI003F634CAE
MYQRIDGNKWRHIWLVGDLHGCHQLLLTQLRERRFDPRLDLLISVGDLIDRGPDSLSCLLLLNTYWFKSVRGNHEQMAIDALEAEDMSMWLFNGGRWFAQLKGEEHQQAEKALRACEQLPYILELHCQSGVNIIAHADYPASHYRWQQPLDKEAILWRRARLNEHLAGHGTIITGADHFWFGHTPLKQRFDSENQHYIDTGAVFGGELTLAQVQ